MKRITLDYTPRPWQARVHRGLKRFSVLVLHRRAGKTELAIMEMLDKALKAQAELALFLYLSPELKQSRNNVWGRLKAKVEPLVAAGAAEVREADMTVRFRHNGAIVALGGADNPDGLRGLRLDGVVVDEVAQVRPEVWTEIVQPALSDRLGWAIFIGTPKGINLFSQVYYAAQGKPDWFTACFTVYDTNALEPGEVERLRDPTVTPENVFAREYLCDFTASGDNQLISLADAEAASRRLCTEADYRMAPRIIGVDPARFGDDRSVIIRRQGLKLFDPLVFRGIDNMDLAARVANVIAEWRPDGVFIDSGAGAGVIDRLRQLGHRVVEVPFGGKATKPHLFLNRRSEMWCEMAEWLRQGGVIPQDVALKQELATPVFWFDNQGRKVLEPKDGTKKRLKDSSSPDIADAAALTFAYPVAAPHVGELIVDAGVGAKLGQPGVLWDGANSRYVRVGERQQRSHDEFGFGRPE